MLIIRPENARTVSGESRRMYPASTKSSAPEAAIAPRSAVS